MYRNILFAFVIWFAVSSIPLPVTAGIEIIIDNPASVRTGSWTLGTSAPNKYGADYHWASISTSNGSTATYTPNIPITADDWQVYTWYSNGTNRTTQAHYTIRSASGDNVKYINQQLNGGEWVYLGSYRMTAGNSNYVRITNLGTETGKVVIADAIRFYLPHDDSTPPAIFSVSASPRQTTVMITWITDEPSTSQVEYGTTPICSNSTPKDSSLLTSHAVRLTGLQAGTPYFYRVKSEDTAGNSSVSGNFTFTTISSGTLPEFRAFWADAWGSGFLNSSETTTLINTALSANYNAIIPQVRKAGDAYYNSAYEPWATNISQPGYDPLADLIAKAHAVGIEVHPWIVTYRIWRASWPDPPAGHIWNIHRDWAGKDSSGNIDENGNYNLDPGVPGVQQYITDVVKDLVSKYDVDGVNFDYIRYMGTTWGYNDITRERFRREFGFYPPTSSSDPNWSIWCDYRRRQVTDLVRKCYVEALYIKPHLKLSVDTIGWTGTDPNVDFTQTSPYVQVYQDHRSWMREGITDMNILMNYKDESNSTQKTDFRRWTDFMAANKYWRHSVNGPGVYMNTIANSITQMLYSRSADCDGICTYSYRSTNNEGKPSSDFYNAVKSNVFTSPVPVPDMPWKSRPTTGIIFGQVTDASKPNHSIYANWVYQATVTVAGPVTRSTLTDATGNYAFINLPPGFYTITCTKVGFPTTSYPRQLLLAGQILREDFDLGFVAVSSPTIPTGWSLLSLPLEPFNPNPTAVLADFDLDGKLFRWDRVNQGLIAYDMFSPDIFGNLSVDEGYWLKSNTSRTIAYQAYASISAQRTIVLPSAGWAIIGCPSFAPRNWPNALVTLGGETLSLTEAAKSRRWIDSIGYWWDFQGQGLRDIGIPDDWPSTTTLQPWHGYWVRSRTPGISLTLR